ncbi:MAG: hypothetical protein V3S11_05465 [Elusimicrobiota bacterium]
MAFEESLEQLSFGRSIPRIDSCIGLYLSPEVLFLAEIKMRGNLPQVLHLVRLPVPGAAEGGVKTTRTVGTLNTEFLDDQEKIQTVIKKAMTDIRWGSKHVMVTLSHHFGILRYFAMPAIDRRFWKTAVPAEAKKYVPIPFETLNYDYQVQDVGVGLDKKARIGALFGVSHKKNLANIHRLAKSVGLSVIGTELAPCSVERLWDTAFPPNGDPYAQVHFDGGHIRILISDGSVPIFFREVFLPNDATVLDRRKVDLAGCIDFTRKQIGSTGPKHVRISGRIGEMENWQKAFAQDLGCEVLIQETDKRLGLKGGLWGGYAAVGTALRHLAPTPLNLDLSTVGKISDEDRRAAGTILTIAAIIAGILLLIGGIRFTQAELQSRRLASMKSNTLIFEAFSGKTAYEIETMMSEMKTKSLAFGSLMGQRVSLTRVFEVLAELIPESAWVSQISYANPTMTGARGKARNILISGRVIDQSRAQEQDTAYRFADKLRKDKDFAKAFKSIEMEVKAPTKTAAQNNSNKVKQSAEAAIQDRMSGSTVFAIKCLSRKGKR